jgi:hypothetical protein
MFAKNGSRRSRTELLRLRRGNRSTSTTLTQTDHTGTGGSSVVSESSESLLASTAPNSDEVSRATMALLIFLGSLGAKRYLEVVTAGAVLFQRGGQRSSDFWIFGMECDLRLQVSFLLIRTHVH